MFGTNCYIYGTNYISLKCVFLSCENAYNECFVRYNIINKQEKEEGILIHKKLDKFKEDFLWGSASAAYQVEGAYNIDGVFGIPSLNCQEQLIKELMERLL